MDGPPPRATGSRRSAVVTGDVATGDAAALPEGGKGYCFADSAVNGQPSRRADGPQRTHRESHAAASIPGYPRCSSASQATPESSEGDLGAFAEATVPANAASRTRQRNRDQATSRIFRAARARVGLRADAPVSPPKPARRIDPPVGMAPPHKWRLRGSECAPPAGLSALEQEAVS